MYQKQLFPCFLDLPFVSPHPALSSGPAHRVQRFAPLLRAALLRQRRCGGGPLGRGRFPRYAAERLAEDGRRTAKAADGLRRRRQDATNIMVHLLTLCLPE